MTDTPTPASADVREALGNYISAALVAGFADGDSIADYVLSAFPGLAQSNAQPPASADVIAST